MKIKKDKVFNIIDTNGRRKDMINGYQIYAEELYKLNLSSTNRWDKWPNTLNEFTFYKNVLERSKKVFKAHEHYDKIVDRLSKDSDFRERFYNLDQTLKDDNQELFKKDLDSQVERRARSYTNNLVKIGFVTPDRLFTESGNAFLEPKKITKDIFEEILPISSINLLFLRQSLKVRIYDDEGTRYYSPFKMILYILLKAPDNTKLSVGDVLALVQQMSPYQYGIDLDELLDLFYYHGVDSALELLYGNFNPTKESMPRYDSEIPKEEFYRFFSNGKSAKVIDVYYDFYNKILEYRDNHTIEALEGLKNIMAANVTGAAIKKAFGENKKLFVFPRKNLSVEEFDLENEDSDFLKEYSINDFNDMFYRKFRSSKYADRKRENTAETRKMLEATGIVSTDNNILELRIFELFNNDLLINSLKNDILVEDEQDGYLNYEAAGGEFGKLTNLLRIFNIDNDYIKSEIDNLRHKYGDGDLIEHFDIESDKQFKKFVHNKFPRDKVFNILELFKDRSNDDEIQKSVTDEADVPTIFEYIVGLAWYYLSDNKDYLLKKSYNLLLNSNYLPFGHAPGGDGDIIIDYDNMILMIEVTLMNKQSQKRGEWEPVLRHSANLAVRTDKPTMTLFVADELDANTINIWRAVASVPLESSQKSGEYTKDTVEIMPLKIDDLISFENSKKFSSSSLISEVDASYSSVRKKNFDVEWRVDIVDKVN